MRNKFIFTVLSTILIAIFTMGEAYAQSKEFKNPHARGVRLDLCKHQGGKGCGKPAADLFCREMNYSRSIGHQVDPRVGERLGRTLVFGDGAICKGLHCRAFASILCLRDEVTKTPTPEQPKPPKKKKPKAPEKKAETKPAPKKVEQKPKKKAETAKQSLPRPTLPKNVPVPVRRPVVESADSTDPIYIPKLTVKLPGGARLTRCILNDVSCPHPVTKPTEVRPDAYYPIRHFQWSIKDVPESDLALWQVSTKPFPAFKGNAADVNFDGLVKSSIVANPDINEGHLKLNFREIADQSGFATPPDYFFLRIIPLKGFVGGRIAGQPSNMMVIHYGTDTPAGSELDLSIFQEVVDAQTERPLFSVRIKSFTPPEFNKGRWGCVVIVEHPASWSATGGITGEVFAGLRNMFPIGSERCPESYRGNSGKIDSFDDFVEFVFDSWDFVGDRFDDLVDIAVDVVLYTTPQGLQCVAGVEIIDSDALGDVCETGARVAVNAGMVALGVPPSLPSYNELIDKGVDYAVELAVDEFESRTGLPCLNICKDAFRSGFEKMAEEIKRQPDRTACVDPTEAHKHGREPMCLPPDLLVRPAPGTRYVPPTAEIEITRRTDVELPWGTAHPECYVFASLEFENHHPGGTVYGKTVNQSIQVQPQTIKGKLFKSWSRDLKLDMRQGDAITNTVIFNPALKHQFPWTKELWRTSQIMQRDEQGPFGPNWFSLFLESQMTMTAGSNCSAGNKKLLMTMPDW